MIEDTIYRYGVDSEHYAMLDCSRDAIASLNQIKFDGTPLLPEWERLEVWSDPRDATRSNFPGFPEMVVDGRAAHSLGEDLLRSGELLPLDSEDGEFYIFNVLAIIDCLDEAASRGRRFPSGRFMWIHEHVFRSDLLSDVEVFKIPQLRQGPHIYITQRFANRVAENGLTGLKPIEVWSRSSGPTYFGLTTPGGG